MCNDGILIRPPKPSLIAIHEAGHGAVALYCGFPVSRMTILREGDTLGSCVFHPAGAPALLVATVLLAGYLAVKFIDPYANVEAANWDFVEAEKILPAGTDLNEFVFRVRRRVYSLWDEISRLAEALDRDGELVGADHIRSVSRMPSWL
jgi:hypothetical protein